MDKVYVLMYYRTGSVEPVIRVFSNKDEANASKCVFETYGYKVTLAESEVK